MAPQPNEDISRRDFLSLMAASMALAGLSGCAAAPPENIVPYVRAPEDVLPGNPLFFATATEMDGYGIGVIVQSREGRPIKVEGNPDHPASLGATDAFAQASILTLYDPDRAQTVTHAGQISTWDAFITELRSKLDSLAGGRQGLRILTETVTSPSLHDLITRVLAKYPNAQWHQYEPVNHDNARSGARMAFGRYVDVQYRLDDADVILSLDADFLMWGPGKLRYAREFARRRKGAPGEMKLNRLYVFESTPSITGAMADHRFPILSSRIHQAAQTLAESIEGRSPQQMAFDMPWLATLTADLQQRRGRSLVLAGDGQPPEVHALVHRMNERLGNLGKTVMYTEPVEQNPVEQIQSLKQLNDDMAAGRVDTLIMIGGNPVYNAPVDFGFAENLARLPLRVHHSLYYDETAALSHWHLPQSHYLESWGDVRAYDGTLSIVQPLIVPLYQSRTPYELLSAMLGDPSRSNYELVWNYWKTQHPGPDFDSFWSRVLREGIVPDTQAKFLRSSSEQISADAERTTPNPSFAKEGNFEVVFRPDPTIYDGRWANNAWLQELPKPITLLVWDNAALMSPATAAKLGVRNNDAVDIRHDGHSIDAAVWVTPGHADQSITINLGYGRSRAGRTGADRGANAYAIRTSAAPWIATNASVVKTGKRYLLVSTQGHHSVEGRPIALRGTESKYASNPAFARDAVATPAPDETLYPPFENTDYAWGMAVDLSTCIGCNACVTACQAENNIPVVGKDQVANGREMHWIRIDAYFEGNAANPQVVFEPMMCQHCENAPCELVCPVEATSHSAEGINEMTYNRCVGTRYCSNNCPYKVRRFNFFPYADWDTPQLKLLYNPDVTVRSRGVMEKCTYCIQRINRARITAKKDDRKIRDGEVVTACQAACPAEAIVFGNIKDPGARVSQIKAEPRNFGVLAELNTRPRTTYLAKLTNPNPDLEVGESARKV
jgi:Fe-S-cluster-containing dehydrogenase component